MQFVLDYEFGCSVVRSHTKECSNPTIPGKHGELINGAKQQCGWCLVKFFVNNLNRKLLSKITIFMGAEHIKMFATHAVAPFTNQFLILIVLYHFGSAPRAFQHLELIMTFLFVADIIIVADFTQLIQMEVRILVLVRNMRTTNPQTNCNRIFSKRISRVFMTSLSAVLTNVLTGTNQCCSTGELLSRQQSQSISHNNRSARRLLRVSQFSIKNRKCSQTEICFRLTTAGGEPNQVYNTAFRGLIINDRVNIHQQECNLEWSPPAVCITLSTIVHATQFVRNLLIARISISIALRHIALHGDMNSLHKHRPVRK